MVEDISRYQLSILKRVKGERFGSRIKCIRLFLLLRPSLKTEIGRVRFNSNFVP